MFFTGGAKEEAGSKERKGGIGGQNTNSVCVTSKARGIACFKINPTIYILDTSREGLTLSSCIKMLIRMGLTVVRFFHLA